MAFMLNKISISYGGIYSCRGCRGNPLFFTERSELYHIEKSCEYTSFGKNNNTKIETNQNYPNHFLVDFWVYSNCLFFLLLFFFEVSNQVRVVLQHNWTEIFSGEMISIRCKIQGEENSEWNYEWRTTGPNIPPPGNELSFTASASWGGRYWCKGRRDFYWTTEWSSALTLAVAGESFQYTSTEKKMFFPLKQLTKTNNPTDKPRPTVVPDTRTITDGGNVTLKCSVKISASWTFYWFRHTSNFSKIQISKDATQDNFLSVFQGGVYSCQGGRGNPLIFTENSDAVIIDKRGKCCLSITGRRNDQALGF